LTRWNIEFTKSAVKDISLLTPKRKEKLKELLRAVAKDPSIGKPLVGDLKGYYSLRLTLKDRILYRKDIDRIVIVVIRCKTHYGD
jgi:Txe/YoeB family toxin of Txe-Axe toxin-antitoxin module